MNSNPPRWSRRRWLSLAPPALAASAALDAWAQAAPEAQAGDAPPVEAAALGARVYNVRDFGAAGDGHTLDTAALQAAIDRCHKEQGGTVLVPAGAFVIGTVELKSNVTLHLAAAAKLLGSADGKQYRAAGAIPLAGDATLRDGNVGLLFAANASRVTIEGPGTIDGQGAQFRRGAHGEPPPSGRGGAARPHLLLLYRCTQLVVRDVELVSSAFHCVRVIQSSYIWLTGIHIHNRVNGNNDGFHFISCRYAHVSDCDVESQDDACALFGSCQFVTVANSSFSTRWSVFRFGGGAAKNIAISNCVIHQAYGCPIKMQCGPGSRFENIAFSNLVMHQVTGPISIGLGPGRRAPSAPSEDVPPRPPGVVRDITFQNIVATVVVPEPIPFLAGEDVPVNSRYRPGEMRSCIALNGVGNLNLERIRLSDIQVTFPGGGTAAEGAVRAVPELAGEYFELGVLPAYALYARNVRGLTLANVRFELAAPDQRPALVFDSVTDAAIQGLSVQGDPGMESVARLIASQDVLLSATRLLTPARVFMQLEGASSRGVVVDGGDLSRAAQAVSVQRGAPEQAITVRA